MPPPSPTLPTHPKATLTSHTGPVHCVAFSSGSGQYILSGSSDRTIHLSNPSTANLNPSLKKTPLIQSYASAHAHAILALALTPDNASFASVGGDKTVFWWDVGTAKTLRRFGGPHGHSGRVNCVALAGTGGGADGGGQGGPGVVISGSYDATVRIWDLKSRDTKPVQVLGDAGDSVSDVAVPDHGGGNGYEIVSGSVDGKVRSYDLRMGLVTTDLIGPPVTSVDLTRDGNAVLVSTLDSTIRLMDRGGDGGLLRAFKGGGYRNEELRCRSCLGGGDEVVVAGGEDGGVYGWGVMGGEGVGKVEGPHGGSVVSAVAWNGRKKEWASGGMDGMVRVWGVEG